MVDNTKIQIIINNPNLSPDIKKQLEKYINEITNINNSIADKLKVINNEDLNTLDKNINNLYKNKIDYIIKNINNEDAIRKLLGTFDSTLGTVNDMITTQQKSGNKNKQKYLKYKSKYLNLKQSMIKSKLL